MVPGSHFTNSLSFSAFVQTTTETGTVTELIRLSFALESVVATSLLAKGGRIDDFQI